MAFDLSSLPLDTIVFAAKRDSLDVDGQRLHIPFARNAHGWTAPDARLDCPMIV